MLNQESLNKIKTTFGEDPTQLLAYLNALLVDYNNDINLQNSRKQNIDSSIAQQEQNIQTLEDQKALCDDTIATDEQNIIYVNELIVLVEATPPNNK
jgi:septal ring factor EnvC (AmiA/AmiB activator)